ncbi:phage head closure protein [Paenibacillus larvae]
MTYDHELTLIHLAFDQDEIGNQIPVETETTVLCALKSVGRSEFYNAASAGLRPELIFEMHGYEYDGEQLVKFEGVHYRVIRSYAVDFERLELTCERVAADGKKHTN